MMGPTSASRRQASGSARFTEPIGLPVRQTLARLIWPETMGWNTDTVRVWARATGLCAALILLGLWFGLHVLPHGPIWVNGGLLPRARFWGGGWYPDIAEHGCVRNGTPDIGENAAFFPLYPLIKRLFHGFGFS